MTPMLLALAGLLLAAPVPGPVDSLADIEAGLTRLEGTVPSQWRVVWADAPATRATVAWTTAVRGKQSVVHYDTVPRGGEPEGYARRHEADRTGAYTQGRSQGPDAFYHHARLEGLEPWTTYYFVMVTDGVASRELHFRTAPVGDREFSVLHGGDSRTGHHDRCRVNRMIAAMADESEELSALLHGGDFIEVGTEWPQWSRWLSHNELTTSASGRVLPIVPTRGNHDFGPLFDEIFDAPGGAGLNYYATLLSDSVALLTLNTNISAGGDQRDWLEAHLASLRPSVRWLVTQYHAPLYPAIKTPASAKPHWTPLFDAHDLDLSLESDGHCIKRTVPIRGDRFDESGVVYVGEGGLGVPQRTPREGLWYFEPPGLVAKGHHVMRLDFGAEALRIRTYLLEEPSFDASGHDVVLPRGSAWRLLAGEDAPAGWPEPGFDDSAWPSREAGFGFGYDGDATVLADMRKAYRRVYARRELDPGVLAETERLGLVVDYDDGFIAYLNGHEICRSGIAEGRGADASRADVHPARGDEYFPLEGWKALLQPSGSPHPDVIAIEAHNSSRIGRTFRLDPFLIGDPHGRELEREEREAVDDHSLTPRG